MVELGKNLIQKKVGGLYKITWNITEKGLDYVSTGIIKKYDPKRELVVTDFVYINPEKTFLGPMTLTVNAKDNNRVLTEESVTELYFNYEQGIVGYKKIMKKYIV
jgi:hypothetical protein